MFISDPEGFPMCVPRFELDWINLVDRIVEGAEIYPLWHFKYLESRDRIP